MKIFLPLVVWIVLFSNSVSTQKTNTEKISFEILLDVIVHRIEIESITNPTTIHWSFSFNEFYDLRVIIGQFNNENWFIENRMAIVVCWNERNHIDSIQPEECQILGDEANNGN